MIKKFIALLLFLLFAGVTSAQEMQMKVQVKEGGITFIDQEGREIVLSGELVLPPDAFTNITFDYAPIEGLDSVDLGLSVKWATVNYKAESPEKEGLLVPWNTTDPVAENWGKPYGWKWRMPTYDEIVELIAGCTWVWGQLNNVNGFWVENKADSEKSDEEKRRMFLPITGYIDGQFGDLNASTLGYYWCSTPYENDENKAHAMVLDYNQNQNRALLKEQNIINKMAIRPVWGDPAVVWTLTLGSVSNIGLSYATVGVDVEIDKREELGQYGIQFSLDGSTWTSVNAISNVANLYGLAPHSTYYYRAFAEISGTTRYEPETGYPTFTTLDYTLALSDVAALATASDAATVQFTLSGNALSEVTYGVLYALEDDWSDPTKRMEKAGTQTLSGSSATATIGLDGLTAEATYHYQLYARIGESIEKTAEGSFDTPANSKYKIPSAPVDLGLSVKWAPFNIGAEKETDYGGLFGWGDPTGELTVYTSGLYGGSTRGEHIGGNPDYDIAAAQWKGYWRLPTPEEVMELQNCNPTFTTRNGVKGYEFTGNNNSIFIPLAGIREGEKTASVDAFAFIWSDSINLAREGIYFQLLKSDRKLTPSGSNKAHGMSVRPVWDDGTRPTPEPVKDLTREIVEGSDQNDDTGIIPLDGVDMGTGLKWARWNVGAKAQTGDIGRYYAWGDTIHRESYTYAEYLSPYKDKETGVNGFYTISAEQDVANKLWENGWRMPTEGEFQKLLTTCECTPGTQDGLKGYFVKSAVVNDSIFFPACGYMQGKTASTLGTEGRYWTSSAWITSDSDKKKSWASTFYFYLDLINPQISGLERYWGLPVRAVRKD